MKKYTQPNTDILFIEGNTSLCSPTSKVGFGDTTVNDAEGKVETF